MLKPEQVPETSLQAARDLFNANNDVWMSDLIAAALNAWPGMNAKAATDHVMLLNSTPALILPLKENPDAEA